MAMIDYGAMLFINGKFMNRNKFFMETPEDFPETASYENVLLNIKDNYFVYAGDKDFFICFYKTNYFVIKNGIVIKYDYDGTEFISETFMIDNVNIKISHLDPTLYGKPMYGVTDFEKEYYPYAYYRALRKIGWMKKHNRVAYKSRTDRWIMSWTYKGNFYEVIFGYGIDTDESIWNEIKYRYDFTDIERKYIDERFKE